MQLERRIEEALANDWMGLGDTSKIEVANPFDGRTQEQIENPHLFILDLIRRPEYFGMTAKWLLNKTLLPFQLAILRELWIRPFPLVVASRGAGKSFIIGIYVLLRALFCQGCKIVIVGAGYRHAKVIFDYCADAWNHAPVLRDLCGNDHNNGPRRDVDRCTLRIGESLITALPMGDGQKIRGQRANILIADEFATLSNIIFENVVSGFASVHLDPVENVKAASRKAVLKRMGIPIATDDVPAVPGLNSNQTILCGSAYYSFNHFCAYWKRYCAIINSKGDRNKLEEIFKGEVNQKFCWKDYSVTRMAVQFLPEGFMDEKHVAKAKATLHKFQYEMEFGAVFQSDSNGFYKRSLIEAAVANSENCIAHESCGQVRFPAVLMGVPTRRYVMGVDPASEHDNFAIVILEVWPDHRRVVYCWTTTRKRYKERLKKGTVAESDFYGYVNRKIRQLLKLFPCQRIALDKMGGGIAVMECLQGRLEQGEQPILPAINFEDPQETDRMHGDHILEIIQFAKADWVSAANHGMRDDIGNKVLLFPDSDETSLATATAEDEAMGRTKVTEEGTERLYDTLEDCLLEIEELKDELASIEHTQTGITGRDKFDTPAIVTGSGRKGKQRKDRFSSVLMANMVARTMKLEQEMALPDMQVFGGFAHDLRGSKVPERTTIWKNPPWYETKVEQARSYGAVVRR